MTFDSLSKEQLELTAKTIRMLSADAVEKANSGHPGMPMGMAECAAVLWLKYLKFNPQDPEWVGRDRFVLSNGHGSMLLYTMLHLSGYDVSLEDLQNFRQWESKTPGHPESFMTPGVECTTGPLGQGISNAVGMAMGQKFLQERYSTQDFNPVDNSIFVFAGDGCLMEGVSSEASSLAGHLGLGNLNVIYDDNNISIAGRTDLAFTEDVSARYQAYGWHIQEVDGHDTAAIDAALAAAVAETEKPSIISAKTVIGKGSPNKADTSGVHGSPLGADELKLTKEQLGWPEEPMFHVPEEVPSVFAARIEELKGEYQSWQSKFADWKSGNAELAQRFEAQMALEVPEDLQERLIAALPGDGKAAATRKLSQPVLQEASRAVNSLIGGSADLEPSTLTLIKDSSDFCPGSYEGLNLRFGVREHAMGSIMNGLAYYGGFIPYGSTFLCFSDYMRPAVRLAALSHLPGIFIYTHESVFLGEDGPTHQPVEHLGSLRMIPNLHVMRPADGLETAVCYRMALERRDGPCVLALTRQNIEPIKGDSDSDPKEITRGAYPVFDTMTDNGRLQLVIIATGSEVPLAISAAKLLDGVGVKVVSMPCWEVFQEQTKDYRERLIPDGVSKVTVEAGSTFGWSAMVNGGAEDTLCIGIDRFGASAPAKVIAEKLGFTPEAIVKQIRKKFSF